MDYENIVVEKRDGICKITMNRPEKLNALNGGLLADLWDVTDEIERDQEVRVVILTGSGRSFSSGFDLTPGQERHEVPPTGRWHQTHLAPRTLLKFWYLRQPTIAAVNGHALAAGNVLALSCDLVIASEHAQFGEPEIRHVAHSPATIMPWIIANKHARWLYYTGDTIDAHTAERWNLVNKVVPAEKLEEEAWRAAQRIAQVPPFAVQMMKRSILQDYDRMGFSEAVEGHLMLRMIEGLVPGVEEREHLGQVRQNQGMRAFLEARDGPFR
ncbi:MAG: enoyl-CoA hydratase/isomerase family protein [Chloroflexi bacterium]|nr:enoyl-CoA hydratase/isomerase family protein [Chloroflexota bacterium]